MAKAKEPATETLVETGQDNNFADRVSPAVLSAPRGSDLQADIEAIRKTRAAQRATSGRAGKKRKITHYHDAERLKNLGLLTAEEHVDCEEEGLFFHPSQYATGTTAIGDAVDSVPPDEAG